MLQEADQEERNSERVTEGKTMEDTEIITEVTLKTQSQVEPAPIKICTVRAAMAVTEVAALVVKVASVRETIEKGVAIEIVEVFVIAVVAEAPKVVAVAMVSQVVLEFPKLPKDSKFNSPLIISDSALETQLV